MLKNQPANHRFKSILLNIANGDLLDIALAELIQYNGKEIKEYLSHYYYIIAVVEDSDLNPKEEIEENKYKYQNQTKKTKQS